MTDFWWGTLTGAASVLGMQVLRWIWRVGDCGSPTAPRTQGRPGDVGRGQRR